MIGNYEDNMVTRRQSKLNKISYYETKVWLISILMITKQGLELMIIFQVWIRQDDFQSGNHKNKSSQGEIMKKKTTSKRSIFQDSSFIRSLCKVVDALGFSCITFFTYAPKSSKSYFVLNILKLDDFMFSTKTYVKCFSNLFKRF